MTLIGASCILIINITKVRTISLARYAWEAHNEIHQSLVWDAYHLQIQKDHLLAIEELSKKKQTDLDHLKMEIFKQSEKEKEDICQRNDQVLCSPTGPIELVHSAARMTARLSFTGSNGKRISCHQNLGPMCFL